MKVARRMPAHLFRAWVRSQGGLAPASRKLGVCRNSCRQWANLLGKGAPPHIALAIEGLAAREVGPKSPESP